MLYDLRIPAPYGRACGAQAPAHAVGRIAELDGKRK
jgi:hypothetical protein